MVFLKLIYQNRKLLLLSLFLLALVVELVFLFVYGKIGPAQQQVPATDYLKVYEPVADNILAGKGIVLDGEISIQSPPGYPLFLAGIFAFDRLTGWERLGSVTVVNLVLVALGACLLFLVAQLLFGKKIALLASLLWMSYPFSLWFIKNPNTEVPFLFFLFLATLFYFLAREKSRPELILGAGICFGAAALIRPSGLFLPLIFLVFVFFLFNSLAKKRKIIFSLILLVGSLLPILPWEIYVWQGTGQIIPLAANGPRSIVDGLTFALLPGAAGDKVAVSSDVLGLMARIGEADLKTATAIAGFLGKELVSQPVAVLKLLGMKIARAWYATSQKWWEGRLLLVQLFYLFFSVIGLIFSFKFFRANIKEIILFLVLIIYFWGMAILGLSILRYIVPAMALVMIFSAIAFDGIWQKITKKNENQSDSHV